MKEYQLFFEDEKGNLICTYNDSRWRKAKWYQKILGKIFPKYKEGFLDKEPLTTIFTSLEYTEEG